MNNQVNLAKELRRKIDANLVATQKLVRIDEITEEELGEFINLYPAYKLDNAYVKDERFHYEGILYTVVINHISQVKWKPSESTTRNLYEPVFPANVIADFDPGRQAHNAYQIGDKVLFELEVYECKVKDTTRSPSVAPTSWTKVTK